MSDWAAITADPRAGRVRSPVTAIEAFETGFFVVVLAMMSEALLGPLFGGVDDLPAPAWLQLMWLPIYAVLTALLVLRAPLLGRVWICGAATAVLVVYAFASTTWSIDPDVSLRRSVALMFTSLLGVLIAARYGWRGMIELFAATYLLLAVGSVIAALAFPAFGVHPDLHPGAWRGLWQEKNQLGGTMAKGALACLSAAVLAPRRRGFWTASSALCVLLVLLSQSVTALLAVLLLAAGGLMMAGLRGGGLITVLTVWGVIVAVLLGGGVMALASEQVLQALGKDPTLTGRTDIWAALMRQVEVRPWEGYGYGAFWIDKTGPAWYVRRDIQWNSPTAHNGWLDILVQLGWTGLVLFTAHFTLSAVMASRKLVSGGEGLWVVLSTALFVLFSMSESTIMQQNNINWVIYIATTAKLLERWGRAEASTAPYLVQTGRKLAAADGMSVRRTSAAP